jgi:type I restriction enzyme R subunit
VPGNFTFLLITHRHELDDHIYKTFAGGGIAGKNAPRAATGDDLERFLKENYPYGFSHPQVQQGCLSAISAQHLRFIIN